VSGQVALRLVVLCAGVMGAAGVALAAAAAHLAEAGRLAAASSMLLIHACAALGAALAAECGIARRGAGLAAAFILIAGASLFAGELVLRQFWGVSLFSRAAPTGGTLAIAGWLTLALAAAWPRRP
jgi:uncharacterized membrane protein YgdD (TMEM256/DUF423 family)